MDVVWGKSWCPKKYVLPHPWGTLCIWRFQNAQSGFDLAQEAEFPASPPGQHQRNINLQGSLTICLVLCPAEIASRLELHEADAHYCPRGDCAHTWIQVWENPSCDLWCCSPCWSTPLLVFLKIMLLHYLMFLLEVIKDEEEDADMTAFVCIYVWQWVWNHNQTHSVIASWSCS